MQVILRPEQANQYSPTPAATWFRAVQALPLLPRRDLVRSVRVLRYY